MNDKKKTHSTQKKYFNTIPIAAAVIGFGIGYFIDKKYYQEPDEPYESESAAEADDDAADGNEAEESESTEE